MGKEITRQIREVKQTVLYQTLNVSIRQDIVIYTDGRQEVHEMIEEPEGVLILPVTEDRRVVLTKEYRHSHGLVYGVPMGRKEIQDTDPLDSAKRELQEEVGLSATRWTHISTHLNGIHEEGLNHFYIAEGLSPDKLPKDEDEDIEQVTITFEEALRLIEEGKIIDLRTMGCIWAGYIHLLRRDNKQNVE